MKTSQAGREGEKVEHPDPDTQLTLSKDQRSDSAGPACQPRGQEIPLVKPNKEKKKKKGKNIHPNPNPSTPKQEHKQNELPKGDD